MNLKKESGEWYSVECVCGTSFKTLSDHFLCINSACRLPGVIMWGAPVITIPAKQAVVIPINRKMNKHVEEAA